MNLTRFLLSFTATNGGSKPGIYLSKTGFPDFLISTKKYRDYMPRLLSGKTTKLRLNWVLPLPEDNMPKVNLSGRKVIRDLINCEGKTMNCTFSLFLAPSVFSLTEGCSRKEKTMIT